MNRHEYFRLNLAAAMKEKGFSQRDMAAAAGIALSHVHLILHGKVIPSLELADKLADSVRVPLPVMISAPSEQERKKK